MNSFKTYPLLFTMRAKEPIQFRKHSGTAIRGAILNAIYDGFCYNKDLECTNCLLHKMCHLYRLAGVMNPHSKWGMNPVRPYTLEPPLESKTAYTSYESFSFGLTLFTGALDLLPIIVASLRILEERGIGYKDRHTHKRGTFVLDRILSINRLTQKQLVIQENENWVSESVVPITHKQIIDAVQQSATEQISLHFKTPTRIIERGKVLRTMHFRPFFQRLLERLAALNRELCHSELEISFQDLIVQADKIEVVEEDIKWVDSFSFSTRTKQYNPVGGFIGKVVITGDLEPLLPWLIWGQFTHVGKNAAKGYGWYDLNADGCLAMN